MLFAVAFHKADHLVNPLAYTRQSPEELIAATREDEAMRVVSGKVNALYVTDGSVNLLEGMQGKMAASGLGAAFAGLPGSAAGAAMVGMYEGEHVQHFGCYVDDHMMIGSFPDLGFAEGDEVKAVVSKLDPRNPHVLYAHAVVRPSDGLLWMPYSISKGRWALAKWIAKLGGIICIFGIFFLAFMGFVESMRVELLIELLLSAGGVVIGFTCLTGYLTYRSSPEAPYAERIFKVLGFKRPKIVNISPFSERRLGLKSYAAGGSLYVYDLRKALAAYGSLSKQPVEKTSA